MSHGDLWQRYCTYLWRDRGLGMMLDISRMRFDDGYFERMHAPITKALGAMEALERGAIANADENRMVGHYWLRSPELAPNDKIRSQITNAIEQVTDFAQGVTGSHVRGAGGPFENLLVVGIGGSALGPQFLADALGGAQDLTTPYYFDNTDPDGFDRVLARLAGRLDRTLVIVVSKSGGTPETANGMIEAAAAFRKAGLDFPRHAVAITQPGSKLDQLAQAEHWLRRFPMWDWVGGRTSVTSAVGLLPAALQGVKVDELLRGAREMDQLTRQAEPRRNPAALLALMWYHATGGKGEKAMVVLPYCDRLALFGKYLQQLIMESLGKELDRAGNRVHQGLTVFGNKGSTDQHSYIQQLRDGLANFFVTFVEVLADRGGPGVETEPGITSGDYLFGFLHGTRQALFENGRDSLTITVESVTPSSVGALIALFERAVGLYAELIDVNAYHQPGVQAGKDAAGAVLALERRVLAGLQAAGRPVTAAELASAIGAPDSMETVFRILLHLANALGRNVAADETSDPRTQRFGIAAAG
jgi:glucose-6-phosphate isomerase